jgi:hypothetical protein
LATEPANLIPYDLILRVYDSRYPEGLIGLVPYSPTFTPQEPPDIQYSGALLWNVVQNPGQAPTTTYQAVK